MTAPTPADLPNDTPMRLLVWGAAASLLLLPLVAMQFTSEVDWTGSDFAVMGAMLLSACGIYELGVRLSPSPAYRAGFGNAVVAGFLLVWVNLAVGMVGDEGNPYNLWFGAVLGVGAIGALAARFRAPGMVRAMLATAVTQALVSGAALAGGTDLLGALLSGIWVIFWLSAARFFHYATDASLARAAQKLKVHAGLAQLAMLVGALLLVVMVLVESEPGLVPLALIAAGVFWHFVTRWRARRQAP